MLFRRREPPAPEDYRGRMVLAAADVVLDRMRAVHTRTLARARRARTPQALRGFVETQCAAPDTTMLAMLEPSCRCYVTACGSSATAEALAAHLLDAFLHDTRRRLLDLAMDGGDLGRDLDRMAARWGADVTRDALRVLGVYNTPQELKEG